MTPESLTARHARGPLLGAWLFLREPIAAELATQAGYDYVCIDVQHGLQSFDTATTMLAHVALGPAWPVVRVPSLDGAVIGRLLDAGALGVIVPMVNTPEQAAAAVRACRYAPDGDRSIGPIGAGVRYGAGYRAEANGLVEVFPMIETVQAVDNVDAIAAVPGIAGLYVGPADLSVSMGLPSGMDQTDPRFDAALDAVVAACARNGLIAAVHTTTALVPKRSSQGFAMFTVGYDYHPIVAALNGDLQAARAHLGA